MRRLSEECVVSAAWASTRQSKALQQHQTTGSMCQQQPSVPALQAAVPWLVPERFISHSVDSAYSGCDSSDCLMCQHSSAPCEQHCEQPRRYPSWTSAATARARKRAAGEGRSSLSPIRAELELLGFGCRSRLLPQPWQWQPAYAAYEQPAAAQMQTLAHLLPGQTSQRAAQQQHSRGSIISALDFCPHGALLAAGSVAKQVRLYRLPELDDDSLCSTEAGSCQCDREHTVSPSSSGSALPLQLSPAAVYSTPGKVGCLSWDPNCEGVVTIGDYDGTLYQVHVPSGHHAAELEAHEGRCIWSVSHSRLRPYLCMSSSDDGTARLWAGRGLSSEALVLQPPAPKGGRAASVCCAEFSPYDEHGVALASADGAVYLFDLRAAAAPLLILRHHSRAASYVRFLGPTSLVSSSTDGTVALWDVTQQATGPSAMMCDDAGDGGEGMAAASAAVHLGELAPVKVMRGHQNEKNFVGLSVLPEAGLIACGSESGAAFAYHTSWSTPLASAVVATASTAAVTSTLRPAAASESAGFVSSVCWRPTSAAGAGGMPPGVLASGTSTGNISLLMLTEGSSGSGGGSSSSSREGGGACRRLDWR